MLTIALSTIILATSCKQDADSLDYRRQRNPTTTTTTPTTTTTTPTTTTTTTTTSTGERNNIIFQSLGSEGDAISKWPVVGTSTSYGITQAAAGGRTAIRFEVRKSDPIFAGGLRAELNRYSDVNTSTYEVWYGLSYFVPTDWVTDQSGLFDIVNQWHDNTWGTSDGTEYKSPLDFLVDGTKWRFQVRSGSGTEQGFDIGTVEKGKWTNFVVHIKFVKTGTAGQVEIWKDGVKTNTYNGPVGYNHYYAPFFKMGIYKWSWNPQDLACCGNTNSTSHTIYISNFRLGNSLATYNDVAP